MGLTSSLSLGVLGVHLVAEREDGGRHRRGLVDAARVLVVGQVLPVGVADTMRPLRMKTSIGAVFKQAGNSI